VWRCGWSASANGEWAKGVRHYLRMIDKCGHGTEVMGQRWRNKGGGALDPASRQARLAPCYSVVDSTS
jgi:hypothetical protein